MIRFALFSLTLLIVISSAVTAEVPQVMSYQGRLTDGTGRPVNDTADIIVTIFDDAGGTSSLWTETHPDVVVVEGLFDLQLGSRNPFPANLFDLSLIHI